MKKRYVGKNLKKFNPFGVICRTHHKNVLQNWKPVVGISGIFGIRAMHHHNLFCGSILQTKVINTHTWCHNTNSCIGVNSIYLYISITHVYVYTTNTFDISKVRCLSWCQLYKYNSPSPLSILIYVQNHSTWLKLSTTYWKIAWKR